MAQKRQTRTPPHDGHASDHSAEPVQLNHGYKLPAADHATPALGTIPSLLSVSTITIPRYIRFVEPPHCCNREHQQECNCIEPTHCPNNGCVYSEGGSKVFTKKGFLRRHLKACKLICDKGCKRGIEAEPFSSTANLKAHKKICTGPSVMEKAYAYSQLPKDPPEESIDLSIAQGQEAFRATQDGLTRKETEAIAKTILSYASKSLDAVQMVIVGGYRRGEQFSKDVDVVLTHPTEMLDRCFLHDVIEHLTAANFVQRLLAVDQECDWKAEGLRASKPLTFARSLVVWHQEPASGRMVNIVVTSWHSVGCALMWWTGDETFRQNLLQYCEERALKFGKDGLYSQVEDSCESLQGTTTDAETAESMVLERLQLPFRGPIDLGDH